MDLTLIQYFFLFALVAFAGFVDSIAGGGGLITVPTYMALGVPAEFILGTNKCVSTTGGTLSIFRYIKNGVVDFKLMIYGIGTGFLGSLIGARLSTVLDNDKMVYLLIIVVPIIITLNYFKSKIVADRKEIPTNSLILRTLLIGLVIGCYDGFFGPGTGTFLIIAMVFFLNMSMVEASPNARVINFTSNVSAFLFFLFKGMILWKVAAIAILASLTGNHLGSGVVLKGNHRLVQYVFNFVLVLLLLKSLYGLVFK